MVGLGDFIIYRETRYKPKKLGHDNFIIYHAVIGSINSCKVPDPFIPSLPFMTISLEDLHKSKSFYCRYHW